ncbi:glycosyltransferase family 4 protein [Prosthecobacter sp.]|uniref:glycosyltransferase family 4 protein n=1 Tax=Prosthecobacter sp. TaxID=1965333 RepID=UPI0037849AB8
MAVMASGVTAAATPLGIQVPEVRTRGWRKPARSSKQRLLWIGDVLVPTGFATVTHAVLNHLHHDWEVVVSGVNYEGVPHDLPYHVMPAWQGGDMWGMNRFKHLCTEFDPRAVIINNDWWNVAEFAKIAPAGIPIIGYMPVDGGNLDTAAMLELNRLHAAVWYTDFGHRAAMAAGFTGKRHVIPHGIDTELFQPVERHAARKALGLDVPAGSFIVGNVNRNQPRKRLDLTIQIFAAWIKQCNVADAYLLLHCAEKDTGWDLRRVAAYYEVADRLILTGAEDIRDLQDVSMLKSVYSSLDVQMTTTLGEGWGLTTMEGMACGIPQIVPDSSALGEWATPAIKIPCSRVLIHPEINTTGSLVDEAPFVAALQALYQSKAGRTRLAAEGLAHVRDESFRWETVAGQFQTLLAAAPCQTKRRQGTSARAFSSRA